MISPRMNRCVAFLVLGLICSTVRAAEPNEAPIHLEFEVSPTALAPHAAPGMSPGPEWRELAVRQPAYAATISLVEPAELLPRSGSTMRGFLDFAEQQGGLSAKQKVFLQAARRAYQKTIVRPGSNRRLIVLSPVMDRPDPNGPERVVLYAMTRDDAQKMAQAYFRYVRSLFRGQVEWADKRLRELTETIAQGEKRLSELDNLARTSQTSLDGLAKTVPYRTESEAREAIGDLDRLLNTAQVEIAGITAKIEAIQGYRQERREEGRSIPQEATAKLDAMLIEESIALRGAEARRQMASHLREQANRLIELKATLANAAGEKKTLAETLDANRRDLSNQQINLESMKQQEPKIPAKVVIYPVRWADEMPGNN